MSLEIQKLSNDNMNKYMQKQLEVKKDATRVAMPMTAQQSYLKSVDASNDGKFSTSEAVKNFAKGLVSPITGMFSSKKSFLTGAAMIAGGAILVIATGGAAAPLLVGAGVAMGAVQAGQAAYKIAKAKNGDDVEKAFYDIGGATGTIGLSVMGAKTSLKQAGVATEGLNSFSATAKCFTTAKSTATESAMTFKTGYFKRNLYNTIVKPFKQSKTFKTYTDEIYAEGQKNFKEGFEEVRDILPEEFKPSLIGRAKEKVSIYDKLIDECTAKNKIEKINKRTDLTPEQKTAKINELEAKEANFSANKPEARKMVTDLIGTRLILDDTSPAQMEKLATAIIDGIKSGKIKITEIRNYRTYKGNSYFTDAQVKNIKSAASDKGINITLLEGESQVRPSGYCAVQMKVVHKNGSFGELQVRGKVVDAVAKKETVAYGLRTGKDVSCGKSKLGLIFHPFEKAINKLSSSQYEIYNKYLARTYNQAVRKESNLSSKKVKLPSGFDEILSMENLGKLYDKAQKVPASTQSSKNLFIPALSAYGFDHVVE